MSRAKRVLSSLQKVLEGKKKRLWVQEVETSWTPPEGLFTKDPDTIAKVLHDESDSYAQAVRRLNFYYNRSGFCKEGGERYDPKECAKKKAVHSKLKELFGVEEAQQEPLKVTPAEKEAVPREMGKSTSVVGKTKVPVPGTPRYLVWVSRLFISPNALARAIYDNFEDFSGYIGVPPRIIVRNRFYAIARSLVYVSGICFPQSPLYKPAVCDKIETILSEAFVRYYALVTSKKALEKGQK